MKYPVADSTHPLVQVVRAGQVLAEHPMPPGTELVVGRNEGCGVTIPDSSVSRMHLRLVAEDTGIYVEDLGSANGTFLDGERLQGRVLLVGGQQVRAAQKALSAPVLLRIVAPAIEAGAGTANEATATGDGERAAPPPSGHGAPPHRPRPPEPPTRPSAPPGAVATPLEAPKGGRGSRRTLLILALVGVAVFGALAVAAGVAWVVLKPSADATLAAATEPSLTPSVRPVPAAAPPPALPPDPESTPATVPLPAGIESIPPPAADVTPALASVPGDPATATPSASPAAPVAASATKLTGKWTARLENLFYPEEQYVVDLRLDLQQRGRGLSGKGQVVIEGKAMTFGVPASAVTGSVRGKDSLEVRLEVPCGRPIGVLQLQGTVVGDAIAGTFRSSLVKGEGAWQAVRSP
jgi:hypothetical protein